MSRTYSAVFHDGPLEGKAIDLPLSTPAPGTLRVDKSDAAAACVYVLYAVNEDEHLLAYRLAETERVSA